VPEGWLIDWRLHGSNLNREPPPPSEEIPLTRRQLQDELTKRDIPFIAQTGRSELWRLLQEAIAADELDEST
jgi:hypothetical protein